MAEINVFIRTADQIRKAEVSLPDGSTGADVIQGAVDNWSLPKDTDYTLVNTSNSKVIQPGGSLAANGVKAGDILEVQPVLVAG
jgi:hypothetical protein